MQGEVKHGELPSTISLSSIVLIVKIHNIPRTVLRVKNTNEADSEGFRRLKRFARMKVPLRTICSQMRISVELAPRNSTDLLTDATIVRAVMPEANAFNIPDLSRFSLRSWEACALTSK